MATFAKPRMFFSAQAAASPGYTLAQRSFAWSWLLSPCQKPLAFDGAHPPAGLTALAAPVPPLPIAFPIYSPELCATEQLRPSWYLRAGCREALDFERV